MVRSDKGAAGVMFTLDTESGFRDAVFVTSSYGLGETVVQGAVNPDEFYVHKPMLAAGKKAVVRRNIGSKMIKMTFSAEKVAGKSVITEEVEESLRHQFSINDEEVMELARYAMIIEKHYGRPMDIEWGKDGIDGKLYILQARPETVQSQAGPARLKSSSSSSSPRCSPPAAPSARRSVSARCASSRTRRRWIRSSRVTCSSPT
jgi:pyruvate,water dikinase